jgi:TetR/AcrR family transcriptional regulator, transcriptional repressor for nem operon
MDVLWSRRYHAAALPDLVPTMKLSRGSLYAAFGDEPSLFLRALDRYVADALTRMDVELDPRRAPVDGLRAYLAGYVDRASGANGRRRCLLVATAKLADGIEPSSAARLLVCFVEGLPVVGKTTTDHVASHR